MFLSHCYPFYPDVIIFALALLISIDILFRIAFSVWLVFLETELPRSKKEIHEIFLSPLVWVNVALVTLQSSFVIIRPTLEVSSLEVKATLLLAVCFGALETAYYRWCYTTEKVRFPHGLWFHLLLFLLVVVSDGEGERSPASFLGFLTKVTVIFLVVTIAMKTTGYCLPESFAPFTYEGFVALLYGNGLYIGLSIPLTDEPSK